MKKIFSILLLLTCSFAHSQIGQFSPIWTYTGSNIQYTNGSTNTSSLNVNGPETVTGTFSVGSTATITGAFKGNSTIDGASYKMNGTAVVEVSNSRMVLSGGSYTAVEISGTKPLIMNSAVLTGGNTGTVAVLSDAVFPVQFFPSSFSPADGTTYYIGQSLWDWTWTATTGRVYLPYNCTLVGATIVQKVLSVTGTAESVTVSVRANNTTDYTLTTTETFSATNKESNITGLSHSLNANDAINVKIVCPTFATNPTNIYLGIVLWFVRRS